MDMNDVSLILIADILRFILRKLRLPVALLQMFLICLPQSMSLLSVSEKYLADSL